VPRQGVAPIRRAQVVEAVLHLLATEGWESVTLRRVTELSGVSAGAITHFLGKKESMVAAAVHQGYRNYEARMSRVLETDATPEEKLTAWVSDIISPSTEREWAFWVGLWGRAPFDETIRDELREVYRAHSSKLAELIRQGVEEGHFRGELDPEHVADQVVASVDGLAMRALIDPERFTFRYARKVVDELLHQYVRSTSEPSPPVRAAASV
jgi:AcrR family transcriptional regulator